MIKILNSTRKRVVLSLLLGGLLSACSGQVDSSQSTSSKMMKDGKELSVATFAGGCFWCVEAGFEKLDGVHEVVSGYSGGTKKNPTYKQVSSGRTKHIESIQVFYDADVISYDALLYSLWRQINPTDSDGQFVDRGPHYRPAIFYHNDMQKQIAMKSKADLEASGQFSKPITTEIRPFVAFYEAEEYHQDYYKKNPVRYKFYRYNSGRDQFLEKAWGDDLNKPYSSQVAMSDKMNKSGAVKMTYSKPSDAVIKEKLTPLQYRVTQEEGTERPFNNEYWNNKKDGIYVDIVSNEPLFSSLHKYDSKTGWPSFYQPLEKAHIVEETDFKLLYPRTEVRSKYGDSHLGHLFEDGPAPTGLRYCINSAALRFVPKEDLEKEGYGEYLAMFK